MKALFKILIPALCMFMVLAPASAATGVPKIGIVIMHGKSGSPSKHVHQLANPLEKQGYLVTNLEMPWSGKRDYDVNVEVAEMELDTAIADLRSKGAEKMFIAGHSLGGAFALYYAGKHPVDGIIGIAPGGNISQKSPIYKKLTKYIDKAKKLVAEGKGDKRTTLKDYESSKGTFSVKTTPAVYLDWLDPQGPFNMLRTAKEMNLYTSVLWIMPRDDYSSLKKFSPRVFSNLPANPYTETFAPDSDHLGAPKASVDKIIRWTEQVATAGNP